VAAAVLNGVNAVTGSSDGAASTPPLVTGVAVNTTAGNFGLPGVLLDQLVRVPALQGSAGNGIVGVALSTNVSCSISGSASVFASIADPAFMVLSPGDTLGVKFFLCNEIGVLLDGALDMTVFNIVSATGTFDGMTPFVITLDTVYTALRGVDGSEYYYADGDMRLVLDDDGSGTVNQVISGTSLDTSYNRQYPLATAYHDQRLDDYLFDVVDDTTTGDYQINLDGEVESRDIDGTVAFTTTNAGLGAAAFTGNASLNNGNPTAGTLIATSLLDGSRLKLIAPGGSDVELQVDTDGDGIFEITGIMTTWAALEAL
jgi:hypothetical protein